MEWLQTLLDNSTVPVVTAFLLGLLTAISPCPLATNIVAIGYICKEIKSRNHIFIRGLLYTVGRVLAYSVLGIILISILKEGSSLFGVQKIIGRYGEMCIGPALLVIGLFMLLGNRVNLPSFGFNGNGEKMAKRGQWGALLLGILFALAFCPSSGVLYFGMLIPMSATVSTGYLLPIIFAIATALPVILVAWILAFSAQQISTVYGTIQTVQKWMNIIVGCLFIVVGIYYCVTILI